MAAEQNKKLIPRWMALTIALTFWMIGIPVFYGVGPWAISLLTPRYGWIAGHPAMWNRLGLIPVSIAGLCLIWIMILHFAQAPERVELGRTPSYLLQRGPYAFSRHPMYLSELALLFGWSIFYGSVAVLIAFLVAGGFFYFFPRTTRRASLGSTIRRHLSRI